MVDVSEIWSDLHYNIESGASGGVRKVINVDAVKTSVDNILRTTLGERVMHPEFGSIIKHLVFQPMSQGLVSRLLSTTNDALKKWDNRVSVESLNVFGNQDDNSLRIELRVSVIGLGEIITHSLLF